MGNADGRNFLISNILSNPDVYNCLKGNVKKQQDLINVISSWWDSLIIFIEGYLEGCDKDNVDTLTKIITASVDEPFVENGRIKEDKLDEVISIMFDAMLEGNQNSEFKMFLGQTEIKNEFCNMALKMEAGGRGFTRCRRARRVTIVANHKSGRSGRHPQTRIHYDL